MKPKHTTYKILETLDGQDGGYVKIYFGCDANRKDEHIAASKILASLGHKIELLPEISEAEKDLRKQFFPDLSENNFSNPDARFDGVLGDFKIPKSINITKGIIGHNIEETAEKKVFISCIDLRDKNYEINDIARGLSGALKHNTRNSSIKEVWIIRKDNSVIYIDRNIIMNGTFEELENILKSKK